MTYKALYELGSGHVFPYRSLGNALLVDQPSFQMQLVRIQPKGFFSGCSKAVQLETRLGTFLLLVLLPSKQRPSFSDKLLATKQTVQKITFNFFWTTAPWIPLARLAVQFQRAVIQTKKLFHVLSNQLLRTTGFTPEWLWLTRENNMDPENHLASLNVSHKLKRKKYYMQTWNVGKSCWTVDSSTECVRTVGQNQERAKKELWGRVLEIKWGLALLRAEVIP